MALNIDTIEAHVARWKAALSLPYYPYRAKWPSRLFHHAPVQNAALMLRDGNLRSRRDPKNMKVQDIAGTGVIDARYAAHDFARLYFRPRTPTQWHVEGIRKPGECHYGDAAHAPILVMLVFDAQKVLSRDGTAFCDRNMQLSTACHGDTEDYFLSIPFDKVYHEGGTSGDRSITEHRCAEVLAVSPLPLDGCLQWVYCRSIAEKETLLYMLGDQANIWGSRVVVSNDLLVFEKKFAFVEEVSIDTEGVVFRLNDRFDHQKVSIEIGVLNSGGESVAKFVNSDMRTRPDHPRTHWRVKAQLSNGWHLVQIKIEGHIAYRNSILLGNPLI